ncbi:MAG: hypothetical protein LBP36_03015, partial [Oscillospiraceae bacterium]|nr:hypothetical protein [Oscillospiraceae bacterium]
MKQYDFSDFNEYLNIGIDIKDLVAVLSKLQVEYMLMGLQYDNYAKDAILEHSDCLDNLLYQLEALQQTEQVTEDKTVEKEAKDISPQIGFNCDDESINFKKLKNNGLEIKMIKQGLPVY